jgi:transcriptional regulator with XRE-family HTH domain
MEGIHPLKAYREAQKPPLSQQGLAILLGVTRETISRWETGDRHIDLERLPAVSEKTGIAPAVLRPDLAERAKLFQTGAAA